jgi:hypothetical protein
MLALIRPIVFSFMKTDGVKRLVVDLLRAYAKTTENRVDDNLVDWVEKALWPGKD